MIPYSLLNRVIHLIEIATLEQMYGTKNSAVKNLEPGSFCARKVLVTSAMSSETNWARSRTAVLRSESQNVPSSPRF